MSGKIPSDIHLSELTPLLPRSSYDIEDAHRGLQRAFGEAKPLDHAARYLAAGDGAYAKLQADFAKIDEKAPGWFERTFSPLIDFVNWLGLTHEAPVARRLAEGAAAKKALETAYQNAIGQDPTKITTRQPIVSQEAMTNDIISLTQLAGRQTALNRKSNEQEERAVDARKRQTVGVFIDDADKALKNALNAIALAGREKDDQKKSAAMRRAEALLDSAEASINKVKKDLDDLGVPKAEEGRQQ